MANLKKPETASAKWVRAQLDLRQIPYFPPLKIHQTEKHSIQEQMWSFKWYATDRRMVEVAGSESSIAELKRARRLVVQWPGYGPVRLLPG
jgi:hypothetical protein